MHLNINIKLQPMRVPNYVFAESKPSRREQGFTEEPKYALRNLDAATLDSLCEKFREDVFAKAGKQDPRNRAKLN